MEGRAWEAYPEMRHRAGLSVEKFGEICGVTKGMVSQWEAGLSAPPVDRLIEMRAQIEFSFDWLLMGVEQDQLSDGF